MENQCVVAIYDSGVRAKLAVDKLVDSGFPKANVSTVARSVKGQEADVKRALQLGDNMEKDGILGAGIGALIGAIGGGGAIALAGLPVLVVAGPLMAVTGAVVGGLIGAINGWGVHQDHAAEYQKKVADGKVLLIAHGNIPQKLADAERVLRATNPEELHLHSKVDDGDDPRVDAK